MPFSVKDRKATIALLQEDLQTCNAEEREKKVRSIKMLFAIEKFHEKSFSSAMSEFLKLNAEPAEVIKLFPQLNRLTEKKWKNCKDNHDMICSLIWYLKKLRIKLTRMSSIRSDITEQLSGGLNKKEQMEFINTTLLKCYILVNHDLILPLLESYDCCVDVAEKLLRHYDKHHELLLLYKRKGLHVKALQMLKKQAMKMERSSSFRFSEMKNYMQHLDTSAEHLDVLLKFSDWIIKEDPHEGLKIFTKDLVVAEELPRSVILDFLSRDHKFLVIPYLEHVIHEWRDTNSVFHETLIDLYLEKILNKKEDVNILEVDRIQDKLLKFLEISMYYDPERVIIKFPKQGFFEETAILYGKLGRYEEGLIIFIFLMNDLDKAVKYCEKMYSMGNNNSRNIYLTLVRLMLKKLKHADSRMRDINSVVHILENNMNKISVTEILPELPDSLPLSSLRRILQYALEAQFATKLQTQIHKSLLYIESIQVQEQKKLVKSKSFEVNINTLCKVCKKPFGNEAKQCPFIRYPGGEFVHILCDGKISL